MPNRLYDGDTYQNRILPRVISWQADNNGDRVFLRQDERRFTFSDTDALVRRYAQGLYEMGLRKGDVLALLMKPSPDLVLVAFGAARLGAIFMPLCTDYKAAFLGNSFELSRARILVVDADLHERLAGASTMATIEHVIVNGDCPGHVGMTLEHLADNPGTLAEGDIHPSDPAIVWWSSGTTGRPKGVTHTHSSTVYRGWRGGQKLAADDVLYACTPMYLGSPWNVSIWQSLVGAGQTAIDPAFSVSRFWDRIRYYQATSTILLGAMHVHLLQAPERPDDRDHTLRNGFFVPLRYDQMDTYRQRFGIQTFPQAFGASETTTIFEAPDDGTPWKNGALGRPVAHYEVQLQDDDGNEVPVGEIGEICLRPRKPDIMFSGYFGDPEATLKVMTNYWYHVGDTAWKDEDGIYYFCGRKKDYIRYKGRNIALGEVEELLAAMPGISTVAAYGVQSEEVESEFELAVAAVPLESANLQPLDIARFIDENAPYYLVPRYIDCVESLPLNGHGRVVKEVLSKSSPRKWDAKAEGFRPSR
ncbi:AMP-binding protein [Paracoccus pantotrophus]|uniref:AMP-binding protein n=1 Tax=Paracoccus pantotrophus TaxID=82367 RepID=UPI0005603596|nr:AMP-binding protein [Paracoccus pantotrophus]